MTHLFITPISNNSNENCSMGRDVQNYRCEIDDFNKKQFLAHVFFSGVGIVFPTPIGKQAVGVGHIPQLCFTAKEKQEMLWASGLVIDLVVQFESFEPMEPNKVEEVLIAAGAKIDPNASILSALTSHPDDVHALVLTLQYIVDKIWGANEAGVGIGCASIFDPKLSYVTNLVNSYVATLYYVNAVINYLLKACQDDTAS